MQCNFDKTMHSGMLITVYIHLAKLCLMQGTVSNDADALWSTLLDLHTAYCGEIDMCNATHSNYTEPSLDMLPVPCCVPCSCSSTCESNLNCCPIRILFKSELMPYVTTTQPNTKDGTTTETGKTHKMLKNLQRDSNVRNEGNVREIRNRSEALERATGLRTETWLDNESSVIDAAGKPTDEAINISTENDDNSSENNDVNHSVHVACLKPQLFHKLNSHPDSDAYEMVVSCPINFKDRIIAKKCQAGQKNENIDDVIPLTSKVTGLTYVNKYCLFCNEPELQSKSVDEWQILILWQRSSYRHTIFLRPQSFMNIMDSHFCNVHFAPRNHSNERKCKLYDVSSCNETLLWENFDETIEKTCNAAEILPVMHAVAGKRLLFKNIACVVCNIPSGTTIKSRLKCGYLSALKPIARRTLSVNYHSLNGSLAADEDDVIVDYIEATTLHNLKSDACPDDWIKLLGRCRRSVCPRDHYGEIGHCIPLYNTLTGVDINFKIKITPERNVQGKEAKEIAEKLKFRISSLTTTVVSLQSRDISVWYVRKPGGNYIRCYLVDILFSNTNEKIVFNRVIKELHDFFNTVKVLKLLQVSEEKTIGLKYAVGHMIDYGGQSSNLYYLIGKWLDYNDRPQNYLTISDVNWCVRTAFTAEDIEQLGRNVYKIKQTNTILLKDQFDIDHDANPLSLYTCIDYFVDDVVSEAANDLVKDSRNLIIPHPTSSTPFTSKDGTGKIPLSGIATAVVILVAVILTIVLVKIKSRSTIRE